MVSDTGDAGLLSHLGNRDILNRRKIALVCSVKCPGSVILQTYDVMRSLRDENIAVISGFHSPMERECLNILLRGSCGVVVCPARNLPKRIPSEFRKAIDDGRMLLLSAFDEKCNRATAETSARRNRLIAALADVVFVPYAAEGGKTEGLCREITAGGKRLLTAPGEHSGKLIALGANVAAPDGVAAMTKG